MNLLPYRSFYLLALCLFFGLIATAQESDYNRWSAEVSTGIHIPFAPKDGMSGDNYISFKQFQLSGRYMFNEKFGLKGHYAFNRFSNPDDSKMGVTLNRIGVEGVANVGKLLNVDYGIREHFGLLFHAGGGITLANPSSVSGTDHTGNILIGLTPQLKLNDDFSLFGDLTYVSNLKQHYDYNGELLYLNYDSVTGSFMNISVGLIYYIGSKERHADWY